MSYNKRISSESHELYYHCITRTVAGEHLFDDREKEVFRSLIIKVADFCGIDVLTYCVMSNHVHILCRVPPFKFTDITDDELMRRYRVLFATPSRYRPYDPCVLEKLLKQNSTKGQEARKLLLKRMHNISMFMKILKLRMSIWFNQTHNRFGTLWAEKFKSIVVEGRGNPLLRMAQYIDLNPIRAGMVNSPQDYPFSGFSDAKNGVSTARRGIETIARLTHSNLPSRNAIGWYENLLSTCLNNPIATHQETTADLLNRQERLSKSLAMGSYEFLKLLMELFSPSFSPRTLVYGPYRGPLSCRESIYYGRNVRPRAP